MNITNYVTCINIMLMDGNQINLTTSDEEVRYNKQIFYPIGGLSISKISTSEQLGEDNFYFNCAIDDNFFKYKDLIEGRFNQAMLEVWLVNNNEEKILLKTGFIGVISIKAENFFTAEIESLSSKTKNTLGKCYLRTCRANFGDMNCKIDASKYSFPGQISFVNIGNSFSDKDRLEPDDYFTYGKIKFVSGKFQDKEFQVSSYLNSSIYIDCHYKLDFKVGDEYIITAGCDKELQTCISKFANAINFRGESFIPSKTQLVQ